MFTHLTLLFSTNMLIELPKRPVDSIQDIIDHDQAILIKGRPATELFLPDIGEDSVNLRNRLKKNVRTN